MNNEYFFLTITIHDECIAHITSNSYASISYPLTYVVKPGVLHLEGSCYGIEVELFC
jgi:hypothetical protein